MKTKSNGLQWVTGGFRIALAVFMAVSFLGTTRPTYAAVPEAEDHQANNDNNNYGPINININAVAPGVGVYDNTDANWVYTGAWTALTGVVGAYNSTLHRSQTTGDEASFTFSGSQFILKYTQNLNRGSASVYLDGNLVTTINQYGAKIDQKTYTSPIFAPGQHTVKIQNAGGGTFIDVDALEILATTAPGVGVYDNLDSNWTYTGAWTALTSITGAYNSTLHRAQTVGDKASFAFTGTQFILKYTQNLNRGSASVYVDGNLVTTINQYGAKIDQKTYTSPVFSSGIHNVEFRHAGGGLYIDIDAIEILQASSLALPDLDITNVTVTDQSNNPITEISAGGTFKVNVTIQNLGGGDYEDCTDPGETAGSNCTVDEIYRDVYLSAAPLDSGCHPGGIYDDTETSLLASSQSSTRPVQVTINNPGVYNLYIYADVNCSIDESNNDNNMYGPIQITVTGIPGVGVYDNTEANWVYTGAWTALTSITGAYNSTLYRSQTTGDEASFTFSGSQFILKYTQNLNRGSTAIYLDGNLLTTINQYGAKIDQKTYTSPIFALGEHTVKIQNVGGGTFIDVDALEILATEAPGVGVYDSLDSNWTYTGAWTALTSITGAYNSTLHRAQTVGDKASFAFTGTQFILKYTQNLNRGSASVYVDGNLVTTINQYGAKIDQKTYTSPIFSSGVHNVEFRHAGGGLYIDIDAIEILATPAPGVGVYDNTDANWVYTGAWTALTSITGAHNSTLHRAQTVGDKASFTFTGTQFILKYTQNLNRGSTAVYVDGNLVTTINQYGAKIDQKTYTSPSFSSGVHNVEFRHAGGGLYIDIDAIEIP